MITATTMIIITTTVMITTIRMTTTITMSMGMMIISMKGITITPIPRPTIPMVRFR